MLKALDGALEATGQDKLSQREAFILRFFEKEIASVRVSTTKNRDRIRVVMKSKEEE